MILRGTACCGHWLCMNALKNTLIFPRISSDPERQFRIWTGSTLKDEGFETGFEQISGIYTEPEDELDEELSIPRSPEIKNPLPTKFHSATHNATFDSIVPMWDLRARLCEIEATTLVTSEWHPQVEE
jgi:hypothetical protein